MPPAPAPAPPEDPIHEENEEDTDEEEDSDSGEDLPDLESPHCTHYCGHCEMEYTHSVSSDAECLGLIMGHRHNCNQYQSWRTANTCEFSDENGRCNDMKEIGRYCYAHALDAGQF